MIDERDISKEDAIYLRGTQNFLIRCYFYMQSGLGILNNFHNIFLGMIALTITFGIKGWIVAACAVPLSAAFILLGRYNVHKLSKMQDWLNIRFSTHYGIKQFDMTREQVELLREVRDLLKKIDGKGV